MTEKKSNEPTEQELFTKQIELFKAAVKQMEISDYKKKKSTTILNYDAEQIKKWMENPVSYENQIRNLSQYFYNASSLYKLVIRYMALMPTYAYTLIPYDLPDNPDVKKLQKQFHKTATFVDKLNLHREMIKAMLVAFREDIFYGYEHEAKDSFFIQQLNAQYCQISSIEDGVFNFKFDFGFFDGSKDELVNFPQEFQIKYQAYKADSKLRWQELDSSKTVCFKVNPDFFYPLPPFATMFESIVDLHDYKSIKKARAANDNFMAFIQKIPIDDKKGDINKFLIDLELAMQFHQMAEDTVPDGIGIITSPMDIEAIKTEKSRTDSDIVSEAYRESFRDAGVSEFLFNSDKNTSIGLAKSIMTDEQVVFSMLRQIEAWVNRKLKKQSGVYKFKLSMLDVTVFNRDDMHEKYLKSAQYGIPVILEIGATLGLSPADMVNKAKLEGEVLGLHDILKPLQSSFNKLNNEGGRESKGDNVSDSTQVNRDNDTDAKKGL